MGNQTLSPSLGQRVARYHFLLRRLHSLSGIIPVGAFLAEHMLTNFGAVVGGPDKYNHDVGLIQTLPWLALVEWTLIFLPLAFHSLYGMFITFTGAVNLNDYRYGGNVRYVLQRAAGLFTFAFVIVHLLKYRFHYLIGEHFNFLTGNAYHITAAGLASPWTVAFYAVGVVAAVYHFSNGIWTALITWGVTLGHKSRRKAGFLCAVIGIVLSVLGLTSIYWFHRGL